MRRKICVVTGTRAEFGLLRWIMEDIRQHEDLQLQVLVTGSHLSKQHGETINEIRDSGFNIDYKVEMLLCSDTPAGVTKSMGLGLIGFADAFEALRPDLVLLLGDRFEVLTASSAALIANIPIAHLHGGEVTEGAFDDSVRHAITKMSHLHFVAHNEYRNRVVQMGEDPSRVFVVGGLGVDAIGRQQLLCREALEESLRIEFGIKNLLVTYHPVTLELEQSFNEASSMLKALATLHDTQLIFTMPNADPGHHRIREMIQEFVQLHPNSVAIESMGQLRYLSCLQFVDGVVGNSSSGIMEAPSMGVATINIGHRQKGRLFAPSVLNCTASDPELDASLKKLYQPSFRSIVAERINPYGDGGASSRILEVIHQVDLLGITRKCFHTFSLPIASTRQNRSDVSGG
jgi:GDP/UDP-N,N'-diacetylbacillosamine 2-epimerase (hydrolysing)